MGNYYDRYKYLRYDGGVGRVPNVTIPYNDTDLVVRYDKRTMRLDNLSYKYYGDPNYGWLLLLANRKYGSMEFEIPHGAYFHIPYPLQTAIMRYEQQIHAIS